MLTAHLNAHGGADDKSLSSDHLLERASVKDGENRSIENPRSIGDAFQSAQPG